MTHTLDDLLSIQIRSVKSSRRVRVESWSNDIEVTEHDEDTKARTAFASEKMLANRAT